MKIMACGEPSWQLLTDPPCKFINRCWGYCFDPWKILYLVWSSSFRSTFYLYHNLSIQLPLLLLYLLIELLHVLYSKGGVILTGCCYEIIIPVQKSFLAKMPNYIDYDWCIKSIKGVNTFYRRCIWIKAFALHWFLCELSVRLLNLLTLC